MSDSDEINPFDLTVEETVAKYSTLLSEAMKAASGSGSSNNILSLD